MSITVITATPVYTKTGSKAEKKKKKKNKKYSARIRR
jgi:hypothetical protein